ncbi:MAG: 4Fe-4S binding protein [Kiritimatiellae bacterium]|nr:4Fe-4S binding protein [Kiritimatiellia bacterium]
MHRTFKKLHLVHFSPGGSTERVVKAIASGIGSLPVENHDLLPSANRKAKHVFGPDDLVVFGSMTAQKLFTLSDEIFACLEGHDTPFIGAIAYGNGFYGIALNELLRRAEGSGFKVAALGAFIARHSIDPDAGLGRPDASDLAAMKDFGRRAFEKISAGDLALHTLPKTNWSYCEGPNKIIAHREAHPEEPYILPPEYKEKAFTDACINCGNCVRHCPTDAIDLAAKTFDLEKCIGCWGCIVRCPRKAIRSTSKAMADVTAAFADAYKRRLEPETFF